jgi:hypothetical protein
MECHKVKRLIVVSNRVQPPSEDEPGNQGGLTVALSTVLRESNGIWFGWSGGETESFTGHINFQKSAGVTTATVDLEPQDIQEYYDGFANRTLWPLFHYRVSLAEFERGFVDGYERVNTRFADTLVPLIASDDLVWVHDYHLIPLGQRLRERGVKNRIGFFLHIPWPPMRLMVSLPNHQELVESLFAYDVVGFHTQDWLESFIDYARAQMDATVGEDGTITWNGRTIRAVVCPIGIDAREFAETANGPAAETMRQRMVESAGGRAMIVGWIASTIPRDCRNASSAMSGCCRNAATCTKRSSCSRLRRPAAKACRPTRKSAPAWIRFRAGSTASFPASNGYRCAMSTRAMPATRWLASIARPRSGWSPLARRDEPGGQGIRRGAGPGRSGRAGAVELRRRRRADEPGRAGQSL